MGTRTVELFEGNQTIRRIMAIALTGSGIRVVEREGEREEPEDLADLLVVDVDSGLPDVERRVRAYEDRDIPVIHCGVNSSRERFPDALWLGRPFSRIGFLTQCVQILQIEDSFSSLTITGDDDPITRELQYDEAAQLEEQLGLTPGVLGGGDDDDVMDLDEHGSVIIEVSDLDRLADGGQIVGPISKRLVDENEIAAERSRDVLPLRTRSTTFNQTMPDTPIAIAGEIEISESGPVTTQPAIVPPPDVDPPPEDLEPMAKSVSRMLAEAWDKIGLAARTDDRADRIERVMRAMLRQGVRGASDEIRRIPTGTGFAGSLEALSVIELLRTARDRKLRGRLEVAVSDGTYLIFIDAGLIEDVENLAGSGDLILLDVLLRLNRISDETHGELAQGYATGAYHQPAEMKLVNERIVTLDQMREARTLRLKDAFRRICSVRRGNFAFQEVRQGDGQPWPVHGLMQSLDNLLLEILRESSLDTGDSKATARTKLVADPSRTAALDPRTLTADELAILTFFQKAKNLGEALERFDKKDVDRVVNRLKQMELLKRTNPSLVTPAGFDNVPESTVVSPVSDSLSKGERRLSADGRSDQTTHMKDSYDIGPDTENLDLGDVDAILEETLNKGLLDDFDDDD